MNRHRDLTDIINDRRDGRRVNAALAQYWEWRGHERAEANVQTASERRYRRRQYAADHGVVLRFEGE
jgi:hypothetical protein